MAGIQPTPAEAWKRLKDGNRRFVEGSNEHPNQDTIRRTDLASGQFPFASIFGCGDSRLAAEIIFDLGLGDAFRGCVPPVMCWRTRRSVRWSTRLMSLRPLS